MTRWGVAAMDLLSSESQADREAILEFLGFKPQMEEVDAVPLFAKITDHLLHPEPQIRYHARKARANLLKLFPSIARDIEAVSAEQATGGIATREILLRKLRLGSRYLVFEAIERLTDSRDPELAGPLLEFLATDSDPFKISFLLKRLARITHPDIPATLTRFLDHPDPRIVANALEGLAGCDVPNLQETFNRLAVSTDNRIRSNAVRALFRYDPAGATIHIEDMLRSESIAMQDSAVFLLGILRPGRIDELLGMALNSRFTTVRLRALEIPRMFARTSADRRRLSDQTPTISSEGHGGGWLGMFLVFGAAQMLFWPAPPSSVPFFLALGGLVSLLLAGITPRFTQLPGIGVSLLFLAALATGTAGILPVPGLLLTWLGLPKADLPTNARRMRIFALSWAVLGALLAWRLGGETQRLMAAFASIPVMPGADTTAAGLTAHYRHFSFSYFSFVAIGAFVFAWLGRWEYPSGVLSPTNRQVLTGLLAGALVMSVLQISYGFGIQTMLTTQGIPSILHLGPRLIAPPEASTAGSAGNGAVSPP